MRNLLLALFLISLSALSAQADEGPDFWLAVSGPAVDFSEVTKSKTQVILRFPEMEEFNYFYVAQKVTTKLNEKWSLGTHPVFERLKKSGDWKNTYRIDLELNPSAFTLGESGPSLSMRNRWELRWKEGNGSKIFHRFRHSSKATWKLDFGPFSSFSIADEIFFEEDKGKISRNRFYPVMLGSKIGQQKLSTYLLYQSDRAGTSADWNGRYVLGTSLSY